MSGLRCRPGDLAVVVRAPDMAPFVLGRFCTVLYAAPAGAEFRLPDGVMHTAVRTGRWVVQWQRPIEVPMLPPWEPRRTEFSTFPDFALRPIRPDADEPATETEREKEAE